MSFFKNFKDDLSQAVNELLPTEVHEKNLNEKSVELAPSETDISSDQNEYLQDVIISMVEDENELVSIPDLLDEGESGSEKNEYSSKPDKDSSNLEITRMNDNNEVTIIAPGTFINGNIKSEGSVDVKGAVTGDVDCQGKLSVLGRITGNCSAYEIYITSDRLLGSVISETSIIIGQGAIIMGDITATSAVISGAVKGNIDVDGNVVVDSTAIIKGNIRAKSIQINKGAIFEGYCSLPYASVDTDSIFE